jgi:hypothetical protein
MFAQQHSGLLAAAAPSPEPNRFLESFNIFINFFSACNNFTCNPGDHCVPISLLDGRIIAICQPIVYTGLFKIKLFF